MFGDGVLLKRASSEASDRVPVTGLPTSLCGASLRVPSISDAGTSVVVSQKGAHLPLATRTRECGGAAAYSFIANATTARRLRPLAPSIASVRNAVAGAASAHRADG